MHEAYVTNQSPWVIAAIVGVLATIYLVGRWYGKYLSREGRTTSLIGGFLDKEKGVVEKLREVLKEIDRDQRKR